MPAEIKVFTQQNLQGNKITNVGAPVDNSDVATKASAQAQANAAQAAAVATAAADATSKANTALASAKTYTDGEITKLINSAPSTLDTLGEIAAALSTSGAVGSILATVAAKTNIATVDISGAGTSTAEGFEYLVNHALNKANILVQAYEGNDQVNVFVRKVDNNSLKIITGASLGSTTLSVVVVG